MKGKHLFLLSFCNKNKKSSASQAYYCMLECILFLTLHRQKGKTNHQTLPTKRI